MCEIFALCTNLEGRESALGELSTFDALVQRTRKGNTTFHPLGRSCGDFNHSWSRRHRQKQSMGIRVTTGSAPLAMTYLCSVRTVRTDQALNRLIDTNCM